MVVDHSGSHLPKALRDGCKGARAWDRPGESVSSLHRQAFLFRPLFIIRRSPPSPAAAFLRPQAGRPNKDRNEPQSLISQFQANTLLQQQALQRRCSSSQPPLVHRQVLHVSCTPSAIQLSERHCASLAQSLRVLDAIADHDLSLLEASHIAYVSTRLDLLEPGTGRNIIRARLHDHDMYRSPGCPCRAGFPMCMHVPGSCRNPA
jgi:hypothetical protein